MTTATKLPTATAAPGRIGALFLCGVAFLAPACSRAPHARSRNGLNLLLVTIDTVRADHVGAYGCRTAETPSLNRLAASGVRFADVSAPVPLTGPSHASILTGLLPPRHGVRTNGAESLPPTIPTLATRTAAAGYRTGAFIGAFVLDHRFGFANGFDTYDDEIPFNPNAGLEHARAGSVVVDRALAWLAEPSAKPFFAWVHLYDAHAPYKPPEPYRSRFPDAPYDGEIAEVDHQVGRLLDWLDNSGLAGSTVVAVAGDHGEGLGEHGERTHGLLLYQGCLHVPMIVSARGVLTPGSVVARPVSLVDLAPTLAAILAVPFADQAGPPLDGRDLSGPLETGREPAAEDIYAESRYAETLGWSPISALRRGQLKYIAAPEPELYDLATDPAEAHNLLPARSGGAGALVARLGELAASAATAPAAPLNSEAMARLQSLGYIGGAATTGTTASRKDPKTMVALFREFETAHEALVEGRPDVARPTLEWLVAQDPANPVFVAQLGDVCRRLGDVTRAIDLDRQAVALAPGDRNLRYNLAATLLMAHQVDEAILALNTAIALDPLRAEAHSALGIALSLKGNLEGAREELVRAVELDPHDPRIANNLGDILRELNRYDEAEAAYRKAIGLDSQFAAPWEGLGSLEVLRKRPDRALPYFQRAIEIAPKFWRAILDRAIAEEMIGDRRAALADYRAFLERTVGDPALAAQRENAERAVARLERGAALP